MSDPPRPSTMDPELRKTLLGISDSISDLRSDVMGRIAKVENAVVTLRHEVFGSNPPPPARSTSGQHAISVAKVASDASLENAAQAARLLAVENAVQRIEEKTDAQSSSQGVGKQGIAYLKTREGRRFVLACFTALTTFVTACGGAYAVATGRVAIGTPSSTAPAVSHAP